MPIERFVVVDDDDANTLFFQVLLKELGYDQVESSDSGSKGLQVVEDFRAQFVITAWEMQPMPGTVFAQKVRNKRSRRYMPCLIYSKRMTDEDIQLTKDLGFQDILKMPFDRDQAKEKIRSMVESEDQLASTEKKLRKIEAYLHEAKPSEALKLVNASLDKKDDHYARAQTVVGRVWTALMKYDRAEEAVGNALSVDDSYTPALQAKAKLYSAMGRHQESIDILCKMSKASPLNMQTLVNLGSAYVSADRHEEAKDCFQKVADMDLDHGENKAEHAKMAFKEGDLSLAGQLLAETEFGAEMARYFNNMAIALTNKGDFPKALDTYKNAIGLLANEEADLHRLKYNLGLAYKKKGDLQEAFAILADTYLLAPEFDKAYAAVVRVVKDMKEKKIDYDKAIVKNIKSAREKVIAGRELQAG